MVNYQLGHSNRYMNSYNQIKTTPWFSQLSEQQQLLVQTSLMLLEQAKNNQLPDYSYLIFPIAKAYEGFLKNFLLSLNLIDQQTFQSRRFRIGRSLNPDVSPRYRDGDWLFDDLEQVCGQDLARSLWETWLECRNRVFHFFPSEYRPLELATAQRRIEQLLLAMQQAVGCLDQERIH